MSKEIAKTEFWELIKNTNKENPDPKDVDQLRLALQIDPELIEVAGRLAQQSRQVLLNKSQITGASKEIAMAELERLESKFNYQTSNPLEKLIIDQILTSYVRLFIWEFTYHSLCNSSAINLKSAEQWEKLISSAQRRFLRAIESLARVKKLGINIQINIASEGGQQVNVSK